MIVVGLMSGTSVDGIDAIVTHISGVPPDLLVEMLHFTTVPWSAKMRQAILSASDPNAGAVDRICQLNFSVGEAFAEAALSAIEAAGLSPGDVDLIGSHGQTVYHAVDTAVPSTLQIGAPAVIAERTGITVVSDFRSRDVAAGGQGAPLVSYVDWLLLRHPTLVRAVQNIGGIANVTVLPPRAAGEGPSGVLAFDTGPGNMLIDDAAQRATDGAWTCDHDGQLAAQGQVDEGLLAELMDHPYLRKRPPKTTGREAFGRALAQQVWKQARARGLSGPDIVATVTAFTAASIAQAYRDFVDAEIGEVVLGGGGSRNPTLVAMLRQQLVPATVLTHEDVGMDSDAKEALAFAVLAYETLHGRPGTLPTCTGARHATVLGSITPGDNYLNLVTS